jgi:hypothetical protein
MAMESDKIVAEAIEAMEFPELSRRYHVMAVPRTVVNDDAAIEGVLPERMFVQQILDAANAKH